MTKKGNSRILIDTWDKIPRNLFLGLVYFAGSTFILSHVFLSGYFAFNDYHTLGLLVWFIWLVISFLWWKKEINKEESRNIWPIKNSDDLLSKTFSFTYKCIAWAFILINFSAVSLYIALEISFLLWAAWVILAAASIPAWFRKEISKSRNKKT